MRFGRLTGFWLIAATLLALGAPAFAGDDREFERFFIVKINDQRVGFAREAAAVLDETLVTSSEMVFRIARFEDELTISVDTEFVETLDGEPVSMRSTTDLGGAKTVEAYVWDGETVKRTTINGGRRTVREEKAPGGTWLTPGEVGAYVNARIEAGADTIVYSTIDASTGLDRVLNKLTRVGEEPIDVLGETIDAVRWTVTQSIMPDLAMVNHTDATGQTLRSELPFGGITMVMERADREEALKEFPAVELMGSTLVEPVGEIPSPRTTRRATYRLSSTIAGQRLPDLPTTGAQRVERHENGSLRVTIDLDSPVIADGADVDAEAYLAPTPAADSDDERVRDLAKEALEALDASASDRAKAEAMRRFVYRYINEKTLGVGFATASEVVRNRAGDCTEHAVLLAAMLRAEGIPSRGANGLIFVDQFGTGDKVFGYHMWTQALLEDADGRPVWEDFDASWPKAMDATHITTSVTDLGEDSMLDAYTTIARLLGVLAIEVESVE